MFSHMSEERPLISPRSPTYERARREGDQPAPVDSTAVAVLARLVEAEHGAVHALRDAGFEDEAAAHEQRAGKLGAMIGELGGSAPRPEESRGILTRGADLDRMRRELAAEYTQAASDTALDEEQRSQLAALGG